jgi:hypothetical protein
MRMPSSTTPILYVILIRWGSFVADIDQREILTNLVCPTGEKSVQYKCAWLQPPDVFSGGQTFQRCLRVIRGAGSC